MLVIRRTAKLARTLGIPARDLREPDEPGFLGSWFANLIPIGRRNCLLVVNDETHFALFIPPPGRLTPRTFKPLLRERLLEAAALEGMPEAWTDLLLGESRDLVSAKTNSRRVLGSMNDLALHCEVAAMREPLSRMDVGEFNRHLNRVLLTVIGRRHAIDVFRERMTERAGPPLPATAGPPLRLEPLGVWDPSEEYWGEEGEPLEPWAAELVRSGPRPRYEMEDVMGEDDSLDIDTDPILEAAEFMQAGLRSGARRLLLGLLARDPRTLDARSHLGLLDFDEDLGEALRQYRLGVAEGDRALGDGFDGVLPWGLLGNRPSSAASTGWGSASGGAGTTRKRPPSSGACSVSTPRTTRAFG